MDEYNYGERGFMNMQKKKNFILSNYFSELVGICRGSDIIEVWDMIFHYLPNKKELYEIDKEIIDEEIISSIPEEYYEVIGISLKKS